MLIPTSAELIGEGLRQEGHPQNDFHSRQTTGGQHRAVPLTNRLLVEIGLVLFEEY